MRRSLVLGAALILTLSLSACNNDNNTKDDTIHVESVSVASIHELEVGETFTVGTNTVTVLPDNATDKSYSLSSGDTDVFTTSGYVITAVGEGSATLTVTTTDGGFTDWTTITVKGDTETEPGPDQGGGTGGDDQPGTGGEGGGGEPDTGGDEPEPDKDVTITPNPTSITVKGGESASFTITVTEGAEVQSVTSDNAAVTVTGSGAEYIVSGTNDTESNITATITITAGGEGFKTATATLPVTVTPADNYTYKMIISNAGDVPTTGWVHNNIEATFTFAPKLETYNRGTLESTTDLSASDVTVSVSNTEETANQIIAVSGLTISPAGKAGTVTVTVEYTGELSVSDTYSYTVTVDETYSYEHTLKIDTANVPESEKVGDGGFDIVANLTTTTTADSWGTTTTSTVVAQESDVSISVSPADAMTVAGLHVVPTANVTEDTTVTITVVWSAYSTEETASDYITLTVYPKDSATYSMVITNESDFTGDWYTEDDPKTIQLSITSSDDEEGSIDVNTLVNEGKITARAITDNVVDINGLTITPVAKGTTTIYVVWTDHTEANASISVTVLEHTYKLSITNKEELAEDWSIEDGERTLAISLESDREDINKEVSTNNVEITYDESAFTTSSDGFTLTPTKTGTYTVTATWVDESLAIGADGVDSFTVNVNDNVALTKIELSPTSLNLEKGGTETLTAILTGKDGTTATTTALTWESTNSSNVSVVPNADGISATVTANEAGVEETISVKAEAYPGVAAATCTVTVASETGVAAKVINETAYTSVVSSPDDRGVYVIGTEDGSTYLNYISGSFTLTSDYNDAAAVRTIGTGTANQYYLAVGDYYVSDDGQPGDGTPSTWFTIDGSGIKMSGTTQLYISDTLTTDSSGEAAYMVEPYYTETTASTTDGTYYLGANVDGTIKYFSEVGTGSTKRLVTSSDLSEAIPVTVSNQGGDKYYMTFSDNGTTTYIYMYSSGTSSVTYHLGTSTSPQLIYYDSKYDVWADTDDNSNDDRFIGYNTSAGNGEFGNYAHSNIESTSNYYHAVLYDVDEVGIKGIAVSADSYELMVGGSSAHLSVSTYPSIVSPVDVADLIISNQDGAGSIAYHSDSSSVTGETAGDVKVTFGVTGKNVTDSLDFTIEENSSGTTTIDYTYTFEKNDLSSSATAGSSTFNGLTWSWTAGVYRGWDSSSSRGIQLSSSNTGIPVDDPFVLTANFGEDVELTTITLNCSRASSGSGDTYFSITLGQSSIASSVSFTDTSATDHTYSGSYTGEQLDISFWTSSNKAIYIKSISFTIIAPSGFSLS